MRLKISRNAAEERLTILLEQGYKNRSDIAREFETKTYTGSFSETIDLPYFRQIFTTWCTAVTNELNAIFPTQLEALYFNEQKLFINISISNASQEFTTFYHKQIPLWIERLREIIISHILRYTDLPAKDRLFIEDIDSFSKVRDVNPAMVSHLLKNGFVSLSEDQVQLFLEQILDVTFHRKDWGGEINDLYTANVIVNGARRATAFLLKGPGIGKRQMEISDCGKRGDQLVRLFNSPAELYVIQYIGPISDNVITDVNGKVAISRASGKETHFLIMDGQDTARLLYAYGKL